MIAITLKAKQKYKICSCGESTILPYCDNTHRSVNERKGTSYKSVKITPKQDITIEVSSKNWKI